MAVVFLRKDQKTLGLRGFMLTLVLLPIMTM